MHVQVIDLSSVHFMSFVYVTKRHKSNGQIKKNSFNLFLFIFKK